ncbi:uncharacterized protein [Coffea arabica]|uniref:Uncharacterized protein n=1 Tax=Coffea arabica TaxID=13443 RepID=A0ABM4WK45_COFAR
MRMHLLVNRVHALQESSVLSLGKMHQYEYRIGQPWTSQPRRIFMNVQWTHLIWTGQSRMFKMLLRINLDDCMEILGTNVINTTKSMGGGANGRANPPVHFLERRDDWVWICDNIFDNEDWKTRSRTNALNRANLEYVHKLGSKSFLQKRHEMTNPETNEKPSLIDLFDIAYRNRKGWSSHLAEERHQEMINLKNQLISENEPPKSEVEIIEQVCQKKSGYICGKPRGVRPPSRRQYSRGTNGSNDRQMESIVAEQKSQLEAAHSKIEEQQAQLQHLQESIDWLMAEVKNRTVANANS